MNKGWGLRFTLATAFVALKEWEAGSRRRIAQSIVDVQTGPITERGINEESLLFCPVAFRRDRCVWERSTLFHRFAQFRQWASEARAVRDRDASRGAGQRKAAAGGQALLGESQTEIEARSIHTAGRVGDGQLLDV